MSRDFNRMHDEWLDPDRHSLEVEVPEDYVPEEEWETVCRRTEDPKLAYIEDLLDERGIPHRRAGETFHAPIMQVPKQHAQTVWDLLGTKLLHYRITLDEMPDNHRLFRGRA